MESIDGRFYSKWPFSYSSCNISRIWWVLTSLVVVWSMHPEYFHFGNFYNHKKVLQLCWLAGTACLLFNSKIKDHCRDIIWEMRQTDLLCILTIIVLGLVSALLAQSSWLAFREFFFTVLYVILILPILVAIRLDEDGKKLALSCFCISIIVYVFKYYVALIAAVLLGNELSPTVLVSGVMNINFAAQFLVFVSPALVLFFINAPNRFSAIAIFFIGGIYWNILFLQDYRGVAVATLLSFMLLCIIQPRLGLRCFGVNLLFVGFGFIVFLSLVLFADVPQVDLQVERIASSLGRIGMWNDSFQSWLKNPIFGVGPYNYIYETKHQFSHPHNFYVQLLNEWGLFLTLAFLYLICRFFLFSIKKCKCLVLVPNNDNLISAAVSLGCFGGFFLGGVSGVMVMPLSQMLLLLSTSICLSLHFSAKHKGSFRNDQSGAKFLNEYCALIYPFVLLMFGMLLFVFVFIVEFTLGYDCIVTVGPRFWSLGGEAPCD